MKGVKIFNENNEMVTAFMWLEPKDKFLIKKWANRLISFNDICPHEKFVNLDNYLPFIRTGENRKTKFKMIPI